MSLTLEASSAGGLAPEVIMWSCSTGASGASASSMVSTAGRTSYSTLTAAAAARAWSRVDAATAATAWPS